MCNYLIEKGSDVNAKGGEAIATPAMWAAQRCNTYIVQLLLQHGADPLLTDAQGYNILHLATFDGNVFLLTLLLQQNIPIDGPDLQGHTCLMWAAYKGYPACVDLFLRWGASVSAVDENGFTALHWALVKGSQACVGKLVEYGSDRFKETNDGKTPTIIADEMKSTRIWLKALRDCGYGNDGHLIPLPVGLPAAVRSRAFLERLFFLIPFFVLVLIMWLLSSLSIFIGVPIVLAFFWGSQKAGDQLFQFAPTDMKHIHQTPYLAGVFAATCFWLGFRWLTKILPSEWTWIYILLREADFPETLTTRILFTIYFSPSLTAFAPISIS
jgi:hypothetical protein